MESIIEYLKINTKLAAKNVFRKFKEYLPFFAALLVIQSVLFSSFITTATNSETLSKTLYEEFDYDAVVGGLTEAQAIEAERVLYIQSFMKRRSFESYNIEKTPIQEGGDYRIYVVMRDGQTLDSFLSYHIYSLFGEDSDISVTTTPLYEYKTSHHSETPSVPLLALLCLISTVAITAIYSIRINSQKFMYGIYITFGANLSKLISTAVFEMMLLALIGIIPSAAFSYLFSYLVYKPFNVIPIFSLKIFLLVIICVLLISVAGVYFPMKIISRKTPLSLIVANDNSNYVSSPSNSLKLLGKRFSRIYEPLSLWRFRKYYVKLILSSVIFTSVFICGIYVSDMYKLSINAPINEFAVSNRGTISESEQLDDIGFLHSEISKIDGVRDVYWSSDTSASEIGSFALIHKNSVKSSSGLGTSIKNTVVADELMRPYYKKFIENECDTVTNSFKYSALNKDSLDYLNKNYEIEGDIYSLLSDDKTVIVSENIFNSKKFDFDVGDKIIVSKHIESLSSYEGDVFDTVGVLQHLVANNTYEFYEYTIGAVIKNHEGDDGKIIIGIGENDYRRITKNSAAPDKIDVLLEPSVTHEDAEAINERLTSLIYHMGSNYRLSRTYSTVERTIENAERQNTFVAFLSSLVLVMCPVVCFFSQTAFFKKRKTELYVLRAYGAKEKDISRLFLSSAEMLSAIGFLTSIIMSIPATYLIYMTMNTWLPSLGFVDSNVSYRFYLSPIAMIIAVLVSVISGFMSSILPYKLSKKSVKKISEKVTDTEVQN